MSGSLRDQLSEAFTEVEQETARQEVHDGAVADTAAPETSDSGTATPADAAPTDKPGRTAGRARDEHGRLLPGKAQRDSAAEPGKAPPAQTTNAQANQAAPAAEPPKPLQRPSTLKKELWPLWDKLVSGQPLTAQEARQKAEWILQRDSDYAKGVSTYKQEAERAKELWDAIAPFQGTLQQHGINPAQHIQTLFNAHQRLALGSPQDKLAMFAQLARDYQVPLEHLFVRGQDGQIYMNPQLQQAAQQPAQQQQPDVRSVVQQALQEERARSEVERMRSDTARYPHFETVRETMIGLLQSGLATDYDSAYTAAIRMPQHSDIFEAMQQQQREQAEREAAEAKRRATEAARRNAISPRTSTPTAAAVGTQGKKGLRAVLEEAVDAHATGRV